MAKNYKKRTAEEIRQETNELTQQALESVEKYTQSPESMKELMDFMSKFPERSFRNQVLIQMQYPGAQACLGRTALNKHKIYIKKGEKGNKIFVRKTVKGFYDKKRGFVREIYATKADQLKIAKGEIQIEKKPYFTVEKVFDITQTQLKPEDYPKIFPNRVFDFQLDDKGREELKKGIDALAKDLNISIRDMREGSLFRGELGTSKGAYVQSPDTKREEIVLNSRNNPIENLATSIHELAHAKMHKFSEYETSIEELQAEMTSYIVSNHFGLDTSESSIPYIAGWTNNGDSLNMIEPKERGKILNDVSRVANQFIQTISAEINQQREMALEIKSKQLEVDREKKESQIEDKPGNDKLTTEFVDLAINVSHSYEVNKEGRTTEVMSDLVDDFRRLHEFYQEHSDQIHNNDITIPIAEQIKSVENVGKQGEILKAAKGINDHCNYPPLNEDILWNKSLDQVPDQDTREFLNKTLDVIESFKEWDKVQTLNEAEKVCEQFRQLNEYYKAHQETIKYDQMSEPIIDKFSTVFDWNDPSDILNSISQMKHEVNTDYINRRLENHSLTEMQQAPKLYSQSDKPLSWYSLDLRPVSIGTHPNTNENPAKVDGTFVNSKGRRYGAVGYDQPISEQDRMSYELSYLGKAATAQEAQAKGPEINIDSPPLKVGQVFYRTAMTYEHKIYEVAKITSIDEQGVYIDWVDRIGRNGDFKKNNRSSLEAYPQEFIYNEWEPGKATHERIFDKATMESSRDHGVEVIPVEGTTWINRNTGRVSHDDTGRCLPLKDGKYIKTQDQVELSGKVFNREVSTSLSKDHFFSGYPFYFPKEQINQIQNERKNIVAAEQHNQLERT